MRVSLERACTLLCSGAAVAAQSPVVNLGYATYQGSSSGGVNRFLGMRFAAAPTGDLRWKAPTRPPTVSGVQPATQVCFLRPSSRNFASRLTLSCIVWSCLHGRECRAITAGAERGLPLHQCMGSFGCWSQLQAACLDIHPRWWIRELGLRRD